jgi:hypothetical protein
MHMTIENYLESEARAAGMPYPMIKRENGRLVLYATSGMLGQNPRHIETFSDNMDALSRLGTVIAEHYGEQDGAA